MLKSKRSVLGACHCGWKEDQDQRDNARYVLHQRVYRQPSKELAGGRMTEAVSDTRSFRYDAFVCTYDETVS